MASEPAESTDSQSSEATPWATFLASLCAQVDYLEFDRLSQHEDRAEERNVAKSQLLEYYVDKKVTMSIATDPAPAGRKNKGQH